MNKRYCDICKEQLTKRKISGLYFCWKCYLLEKKDFTLEQIKMREAKK